MMMYHSEQAGICVLRPTLKAKQEALGVGIVPITKREHAERLVAYLRDKRPLCAWDTETISCNVEEESPVGKAICVSFSLSFNNKIAYYVPCYGDYIFLLQCFAPWLEDEACPKSGHNIRFDMHVAANHGITVRGVVLDTQVADWLYDENAYSFRLEDCVEREFKEKYADYSNTFTYWGTTKAKANRHKKPSKVRDLSERINPQSIHYEPGKLMLYGAKDAWIEYRLAVREAEKLQSKPWAKGTLRDYYEQFEAPYLQAIYSMERRGITIDVEHMRGLDSDWERDIVGLEKEFIQGCIDAGAKQKDLTTLNLNSQQQLTHLFFDVLKLPPGKKTEKGAYKLDKGEMERLAGEGHTVFQPFARWRSLMKLRGTYAIPLQRVDKHSRVYTSFKQHGTVTGRLCIAKGTLVEVLRDVSKYPKGVPIEDVRPGDWAYTYDAERNLTLRRVVWAGKTGRKRVVRLHWQGDGRTSAGYLDLTPEHRVRLVSGEYKAAGELLPGERVLSLSRGVSASYGYARLWATGHNEIPREHRFVYQHITGCEHMPQHVHHKNHNKLDNRPDNLEGMTASEHTRVHAFDRPLEVRREIANRNFGPYRGKLAKKGEEHANWLGLTREWMVDVLWKHAGKPTAFRDVYGIDYGTVQKYLEMHDIDVEFIRLHFNKRGQRLTLDRIRAGRKVHKERGQKAAKDFMGLDYYRWRKVQEERGFIPYNHRVVRVEKIDQVMDVYDLEVEETHNFIANELCVHNSSDHPNLMNIPARTKEGERLRAGFTARKGMVLVCADLSQIELRILAHYAQDKRMIEGFTSNEDFHAITARDMFPELKDMSTDDIKEKHPKLRSAAKTINFGINYGMGPDKLANQLKISKDMAAEYMAKHDRTFPGIGEFRRATMMFAKRYGYIQTYTMRYRNCPDMDNQERWKRMLAERQAFNSKIQGSAADIIKMAMILLHEDEEMSELNAHLLLQVHDELVLEVAEKHAERVKNIVVHYMQEPYQYFGLKPLRVPTIAEASIGKNWLEAKK
jgi:DNA polymerase I-like protein with 3'-5' exonuclease and polymerase domains